MKLKRGLRIQLPKIAALAKEADAHWDATSLHASGGAGADHVARYCAIVTPDVVLDLVERLQLAEARIARGKR